MRALYSMAGRVSTARIIGEHRRALVPVGLAVAVNLAVLLLGVLPLSQRVAGSDERAATAEATLATATAELRRAEAARDGSSRATTDLDTFYQQVLPGNVASARRLLQLRLRQTADRHDVTYQGGGTTEEEMRESRLLRLSSALRLSGDYADIRRFLYDLESAPDFLIIDTLQLEEGNQDEEALAVTLQVSTYYRAPASNPAAERTGTGG